MSETPNADRREVEKWLGHIEAYDRAFAKWEKRVEKIIKRYRDERPERSQGVKFNILWSNTQVLSAATFARLPKPDVSRRFKDHDPVGRVASLILERALEYEVEHYPDYSATLKSDVLDRFLGGRATAWARYEPNFKKQPVQITEDVEPQPDELDYECAPVDYVHWKDFGHTIARSWEEVTAVWRQVYLDRDALVERFGDDGNDVPLDAKPEEMKEYGGNAELSRGCIYEIWDKSTRQALWLSKSLGKIMDSRDDPLGLEEFFPCPKPMYATLANDKLEPTPDFAMYQDQADQLDVLAQRIEGLIEAMKVMGVYDASIVELGRMFTEGDNTNLFPIKNWAAYAEKGKLAGAVEFTDLKPIYEALQQAYMAFEQIKGQIYEITRISDIMRGEVDPREKLGQSQLKSQYGNLGIKAYQYQVSKFATDLLRLKAQIMCNKFSPNTLVQISAVSQLSDFDKQLVPQAMELLLGPRVQDPEASTPNPMRSFRIEIAADSMIQIDEDAEKDARMSMIAANSGFLKEAVGMLAGAGPAGSIMVPLVMEIWKFGIAGFKVGKTIEGAFDEVTAKLQQLAAAPKPPPPPDPALVKVQAETEIAKGELQLADRKQAFEEKKHTDEMRMKALELQKPQPVEPVNPEREQAEVADIYAGIDLKVAQAEKARTEAQLAPQKAAVEIQSTQAAAEKTSAETNAIKMPVDAVDVAQQEAAQARGDIQSQLLEVKDAVVALQGRALKAVERVRGKDGTLIGVRHHFTNGETTDIAVH